MKNKVVPGRFTTITNESFVVFIIGMRINKRWAIHKWWPVFTAMPKMLKELMMNKEELGFHHYEMTMGTRVIKLVQYWNSVEALNSYARGEKHMKAWKDFYQKASNNAAVGIYHETYYVTPENYECIYSNMPIYGLAGAFGREKITAHTATAKKRMDYYNKSVKINLFLQLLFICYDNNSHEIKELLFWIQIITRSPKYTFIFLLS